MNHNLAPTHEDLDHRIDLEKQKANTQTNKRKHRHTSRVVGQRELFRIGISIVEYVFGSSYCLKPGCDTTPTKRDEMIRGCTPLFVNDIV